MKRLKLKLTKNNDEELKKIANYIETTGGSTTALYDNIEEMKNQMIEGICHFVFIKTNGETRDAYGTRASDLIEKYSEKKGKKEKKDRQLNGAVFPYFDLEKQEWRCFKVESLIHLDREYAI